MKHKISKYKILPYIPIIMLSVVFIYPFWWMLVNSLNTAADILAEPSLLPRSWQWQNYVEIFKVQPFARQYVNTLFIAILGTAGILCRIWLRTASFPGQKSLVLIFTYCIDDADRSYHHTFVLSDETAACARYLCSVDPYPNLCISGGIFNVFDEAVFYYPAERVGRSCPC